LNEAAVPTPFVEPGLLEPATVTTSLVETVIIRIMWLPQSATAMRAPPGENDTPKGLVNEALVPTPSAEPGIVEPAMVMTSLLETVTIRTIWSLLPPTARNAPSGENDTPRGRVNEASVPTPFAEPGLVEPATVTTSLVETVIIRIMLFI
jgi:hypothetical protein